MNGGATRLRGRLVRALHRAVVASCRAREQPSRSAHHHLSGYRLRRGHPQLASLAAESPGGSVHEDAHGAGTGADSKAPSPDRRARFLSDAAAHPSGVLEGFLPLVQELSSPQLISVEHAPYFFGERRGRKRLREERDVVVDHAFVNDLLLGVSRHEKDLEPGTSLL